MWVVKLGGSLLGTSELKQWLKVLAEHSDGRIVIVPGGGVFADTIRLNQQKGGYDDAAAHHMALLAMEQYAHVMKSLLPELALAASELEIAERSWQHRPIAWLPSAMVLADDEIPQDWEVTSDSLAAWLAGKIGADRLILVKHADTLNPALSIDDLIDIGMLDSAFAKFSSSLSCPIDVVGKSAYKEFEQVWTGGPIPALAI
jgi:aspartokinase-like uncharacterized kinase